MKRHMFTISACVLLAGCEYQGPNRGFVFDLGPESTTAPEDSSDTGTGGSGGSGAALSVKCTETGGKIVLHGPEAVSLVEKLIPKNHYRLDLDAILKACDDFLSG